MTSRSRHSGLRLQGAALLLALAAGGLATAATATPAAAATPCHVRDIPDRAVCHTVTVPENRAAGQGTIELHVAVLPATRPTAAPSAVFLLAGGPGQAATEQAFLFDAALADLRETRDIVLMDQRGTGKSRPLSCDWETIFALEIDPDPDRVQAELAKCRAGWGVDLRHYSTLDVVEDVEAVRQALGYAQLDLWGGSWGTRTGLLYMRAYPQRVRTAVLDGVAPPNTRLFLNESGYADAAFTRMLEACAADSACSTAFPDFAARVRAFLDGMQDRRDFTLLDAATGQPRTVALGRDGLVQAVRGSLYSPVSTAQLPFALDRLMQGEAAPLVALSGGIAARASDTLFIGSTLASLCREELARTPGDEARAASASHLTRDSWFDFWERACAGIPVDPLPAGYDDPVKVDVPVLLLSGGGDPVTAPASADFAAKHLPRAWHVVAPAAGHIVSTHGCAGDIVAEFVEKADGSGIDTSCLTEAGSRAFTIFIQGPRP